MKISELKDIIIKEFGEEEWQSFKEKRMYKIYNLPAKERIKELRWYGGLIAYINKPTKKEQKVAIMNNWRNFQFIDNPSDEIKLYAIKKNGLAIQYIKNPTEEMKKEAIKCNYEAIKYIENPSEELQLLALSISHYSLFYMHNLSERVMKEAVKGDIFDKACTLKYIENDLKEEE
nr:MAG TPA: protein of unknown function (DUF4116) [Caudoviricetes sp.]